MNSTATTYGARLEEAPFVMLVLAAFFIPVFQGFAILSALLGLLFALVLRHPLHLTTHSKYFVWVVLSIWLWQAAGLLYTSDISTGLFHLQQKLGLLLFIPCILALGTLTTKRFSVIASAFVLGCLGSTLYFLVRSYLAWKAGADYSVFQYVHLSAPFHPSYFALYLSFSIALLIWLFTRQTKTIFKCLLVALSIAFYLVCILLQSKAGLFAATLVLPLSIWFNSPAKLRRPLLLGAVVILVAANAVALSLWLAKGESRMEQFLSLFERSAVTSTNPNDANAVRFVLWKTSLELSERAVLAGFGSGDVKHVLREELTKNGQTYAASSEFNAHNQFLQSLLAGGLPALFLLLLYLFLPLRDGITKKRSLNVILVFLLFLQFQPEAMLEAQEGILFCGFWLSLLVLRPTEG